MSEKEELALPSAVITRLLKDAIPDGINISKEARAAVSRAAAIFVLYTTACASHAQAASQRKTLTIDDVYAALEDMLFEDMIDPIKESLQAYHAQKSKKESLSNSPTKGEKVPKKRKRSQSATAKETESANVFDASASLFAGTSSDLMTGELETDVSAEVTI
ncbi:DNA polymerase epsilon subunit 3 [Parasteatoda tepidariorum]|uniref:DNA polymerase epsilon subunit 3 n=1 Tax=Parasteatoda tepidariorum TaxID=114398 RepID=A0A2L2YN40_PARTP|nr:DNA polymerase epsilon subunit 3 [Parasteatoda tepidariorum]